MPASADETAALLARVPVFDELADEDLRRVADVSVPRRFGAGEVVFREGDDSDTCYVVHAGHARAIREHPDGRQITLATFGPGDIFGELAMFDDERRSATVEASDDLEVLGILGPDMRRMLREHPDMAVKMVISLGRRLRAANERLARQSFQTVQSRVAAVLAQLVDQAHSEGAAEHDVAVVATQADLAKLAGSSRESASRFLAVLERAGVISQGRGRLPCTTRRRFRAMSTDRPLKETSYGGVVVRGDEVLVITPIGKRRVTGLPKGGPNPGERPEETAAREVREETGSRPPCASRSATSTTGTGAAAAGSTKRSISTCATTSPGRPTTTTTRSRRRAGSRSPRPSAPSATPASGR